MKTKLLSTMLLTLAGTGMVQAQELVLPDSPIADRLRALSIAPPQETIGALIEAICPPAAAFPTESLGRAKVDLTPGSDLKARCDEMVVNAINARDLNNVVASLQAVAGEEVSTLQTAMVDLASGQNGDVSARLAGLRGNLTSGLAVNGNGMRYTVPLAAGDASSRLGGFFSANLSFTDRDPTANESGFDGEQYGFTAGLDYQFTDQLVAGAAFSYLREDYDLDADGGSLKTDQWGLTGYMNYAFTDDLYLDIQAGFSKTDFDQERNVRYSILTVAASSSTTVDQVAMSKTDSSETFISVNLGKDWDFGDNLFNTYAGLNYSDTSIDAFRETMSNPTAAGSGLALFIDKQSPESLIATLGANLQFNFETAGGYTWYPYLMAEYLHEFENDAEDVTGGFVDDPNQFRFSMPIDPPDRNFFNVGAGVIAPFSAGNLFFLRYQALVGYRDLSLHTIEAGVKLTF